MNPEYLNIAAIQTSLYWEDKEANLHMLGEKIRAYSAPADVFVLPEMFSTGFSMRAEKFAEPMDGPTHQWMREMAKLKRAAIAGSIIVSESGRCYNRLLWVNPDGSTVHYDKRHLFRMGQEDQHYAWGIKRMIVDYNGWRICLQVCYDLRFPVWSRNRYHVIDGNAEAEYDVLLYVANWPERRSHPWKTLLMARAIENASYVVGVNRVGNDGNFIYHCGDTAVYDFKGALVTSAMISTEEIISARLSKQDLREFRKSFPVGLDADSFTIQ
jgi:predicted amidohydrolase